MKVLLAHPHRFVADGIRCIIEGEWPEADVVGTWYAASDGIENTRLYRPDMIITAPGFGDGQGPGVVRSFKEAWPQGYVVIFSSNGNQSEFLWTLEAGASAYMNLDCSREQIVDTLKKVAEGEIVVCGVDRAMPVENGDRSEAERVAALVNLTPREREVLEQLSRGFSNRRIAENLFVSEHTVRTHVQNLRSKLNVRSKFEAAVLAMQASGVPGTTRGGFRL